MIQELIGVAAGYEGCEGTVYLSGAAYNWLANHKKVLVPKLTKVAHSTSVEVKARDFCKAVDGLKHMEDEGPPNAIEQPSGPPNAIEQPKPKEPPKSDPAK